MSAWPEGSGGGTPAGAGGRPSLGAQLQEPLPAPGELVRRMLERARRAARVLADVPASVRDGALVAMAGSLRRHGEAILAANARDVRAAQEAGMRPALLDRLRLDPARLEEMARGLERVAALEDPLSQVKSAWRRPNGLEIAAVRVPLGVVGVIYEARPNVTAEVAALCIKSGNAVLMRGGSEALGSNLAIAGALREGVAEAGLPEGCVDVVPVADRQAALSMMQAVGWIDLLIPRGGPDLIRTVVEQARVPVIETGVGNVHIYIDASAAYDMAERIVLNAKVQRPSVCNAVETLLVHREFAARHLARLVSALRSRGVEIRGCPATQALAEGVKPATEEDWATEFLDLILAVRVVDSLDEAIEHIDRYSSRHSEAIVTSDWGAARRFTRAVDAAVVYVNASTRFTDGFEFGFGAEVGISTQKLHARGPMGLEALTTVKYVVSGDGQVRA